MSPSSFDIVPGSPESFKSYFLPSLTIDHLSNQPSSSSGVAVQQPTPSFTPPSTPRYCSVGIQVELTLIVERSRFIGTTIKKPHSTLFSLNHTFLCAIQGIDDEPIPPSLTTPRRYTSQVAHKTTGHRGFCKSRLHPKPYQRSKPSKAKIIEKLRRQGICQENIIRLDQEAVIHSRLLNWRGIYQRCDN
jgi:hypothetical protein